jgi:hypothetical protein
MLLECCCDGGFSGGGETGEPDCETVLLAQGAAFGAREAFVPCYVPIAVLWLGNAWDGGVGGVIFLTLPL